MVASMMLFHVGKYRKISMRSSSALMVDRKPTMEAF